MIAFLIDIKIHSFLSMRLSLTGASSNECWAAGPSPVTGSPYCGY